jgi:uracil-DNA glycosylase
MELKPEDFLDPKWRLLLQKSLSSSRSIMLFKLLNNFIKSGKKIYPEIPYIFNSLNLCLPNKINIVIIGQDPYHGNGQANGLAFSVNDGIKIPPSLRNIFLELDLDLKIPISNSGNLEPWAKQGVLLLNTCLTVEQSKPGSHQNIGWEELTDTIISRISQEGSIVFILWGAKAHTKENIIYKNNNLIIKSAHPSPFSARRGFFGTKPFSRANNFLKANGKKEINWNLDSE